MAQGLVAGLPRPGRYLRAWDPLSALLVTASRRAAAAARRDGGQDQDPVGTRRIDLQSRGEGHDHQGRERGQLPVRVHDLMPTTTNPTVASGKRRRRATADMITTTSTWCSHSGRLVSVTAPSSSPRVTSTAAIQRHQRPASHVGTRRRTAPRRSGDRAQRSPPPQESGTPGGHGRDRQAEQEAHRAGEGREAEPPHVLHDPLHGEGAVDAVHLPGGRVVEVGEQEAGHRADPQQPEQTGDIVQPAAPRTDGGRQHQRREPPDGVGEVVEHRLPLQRARLVGIDPVHRLAVEVDPRVGDRAADGEHPCQQRCQDQQHVAGGAS